MSTFKQRKAKAKKGGIFLHRFLANRKLGNLENLEILDNLIHFACYLQFTKQLFLNWDTLPDYPNKTEQKYLECADLCKQGHCILSSNIIDEVLVGLSEQVQISETQLLDRIHGIQQLWV